MRAVERRAIREELVWRGFGEISATVFAHPEFDLRTLRSQRRSAGLLSKVIAFDAALAADDAPQQLIHLGWDLDDLGLRYQRFVKRFASGTRPSLNAGGKSRLKTAFWCAPC